MPRSGLLIFGTSHVGKSTLAGRVGDAVGARVTSTDKLGRHPGRPWPQVRPAVEEYYSRLTDETIYWFLRVHHENIWPTVEHKIMSELNLGGRFVVEGSALRPEMISALDCSDLLIVGLYADSDFLRIRMEAESHYTEQSEHRKMLISRFVARSLRDNDQMIEEARRLGLRLIDVTDPANFQTVAKELTAI
jgi:2-phosphoglycerate kinase